MNKVKLHLGCGNIFIPDYINIDIERTDKTDLICDISRLPFKKNSIDLIYSCANIEHFGREGRSSYMFQSWKNVIKHWYDLLKIGGELYLSTADFEKVCNYYLEKNSIEDIFGFIVGGQKTKYDYHGMIFDFNYLKTKLEEIGFSNVQRYNWEEFDVGILKIDDYSQSYIPHMDKKNGELMMLNIKALKKDNLI
jgi:predicted SAM-dependent methyltransferase